MKKFVKLFSLLAILLMLGITLTACTKTETTTTTSTTPTPTDTQTGPRKFVIAVEEWPPYDIDDGTGGSGIEIDAVKAVLDKLGVQYEIKFMPWARAVDSVTTGTADGILSASYKEERESFLYFTETQRLSATGKAEPQDYVFLTEYVFFINKVDGGKITFDSYPQLKAAGYKVGINDGYSYSEEFFAANLTTVIAPTDQLDDFNALIEKRYDLYLGAKAICLYAIKENNLGDKVSFLPKPVLVEENGLLFSKTSNYPDAENVMKRFYAEMKTFRASAEYQQIYDKYTK